jgi:hypothetical protein
MGTYEDLSLFIVRDGQATAADCDAEFDGVESILVAATSPDSALEVADRYDAGFVGLSNMEWEGKTIAVVCVQDTETGAYW